MRADLLAGLMGAIVVLPQGVAFAILAGMPPVYGLYAAMVPCIIAALFGSSRLMVTLLAVTEAMAIAKAFARRMNESFDANQELVGQGLANFVGAFFSSYPASGSFNRSGVNVAAVARARLRERTGHE